MSRFSKLGKGFSNLGGSFSPVSTKAHLPTINSVFNLYADKGITNTGGVVTQWADPLRPSVTLTVPNGYTGPTVSGKIQGYSAINWSNAGNGNALSITSSVFAAGSARTTAAVASITDYGSTLCTLVSTSTANPSATLMFGGGATNSHGFSWTDGVADNDIYTATDGTFVWLGAPAIITHEVTPGSGGVTIRINGFVVPGQSGTTQVEANGNALWVGHNSVNNFYAHNGVLQELHGWNSILGQSDLDKIEDYLAPKFCIVGTNRWTSDSKNYVVFTSQGNSRAPNASTIVRTNATSLLLSVINNSIPAGTNFFSVLVDGAISQTYTVPSNSDVVQTFTLALDGASHTVEIWNGTTNQAGHNGSETGIFLTQIQDDSGTTALQPAQIPNERTVVYGDSITVTGAYATNNYGMFQRLRTNSAPWGGRISFMGGNGRALWHDYNADNTFTTIAHTLADLVSEVTPGGVQRILIPLCTNDQNGGSNYWASAAAFQAALQMFLTKLASLVPASVRITVIGLGITSNDNTPNNSATPWSVANGRAAQSAAVTTVNISNVKYVDGSVAFNGVNPYSFGQLVDGLHPNDAGHAQMALWYSALRDAGY